MLRRSVHVSILYFGYVLIVGGLTVTLENTNAARHTESNNVICEFFLTKSVARKRRFTRDEEQEIDDQLLKSSKFKNAKKFRPLSSRTKVDKIVTSASFLQKNKTQKPRNKTSTGRLSGTLEVPVVKKEGQITQRDDMRKFEPTKTRRIHDKAKRVARNIIRREPSDIARKQGAKMTRGETMHILRKTIAEKKLPVKESREDEDLRCGKFSSIETSLLLKNLFRMPEMQNPTKCSDRNGRVQRSALKSTVNVSPIIRSLRHRIVDAAIHNEADREEHLDDDGVEMDYYLSSIHKRDVEEISDDHEKTSRITKAEDTDRQHMKEISKGETALKFKNSGRNSTSQISMGLHNVENIHSTEIPWPLVPGPISCDLDFQLQPSFVARLGEFDYVVSVQLQRNPDEPADHACTGVIYNPRFIVIATHCIHDNYGLTVTSTDDLCTIDEMVAVDYIIEHENYDTETRRNDIALIKLKSEIHKRSAKFPKDDGALGETFYAVGFGELMWRSFPDKISKLLQKVPVRRYPRVVKETPGTLHITMSHMDLTGAFRGDFGGTLINPRGEFVGLKSKLVKKSTEYEVYTRVRTYLPWIQSMVALHGSW